MSTSVAFNVEIAGKDKFEVIGELLRVAAKVVSNLSDDTKAELLVKLVMHGVLQDSGHADKLDVVDMLQDSGLYIGDAARKRMAEDKK